MKKKETFFYKIITRLFKKKIKPEYKRKFYCIKYLRQYTLKENRYLIDKLYNDACPVFKAWLYPLIKASEGLIKTKTGCYAFHRGLAISLGNKHRHKWFIKLETEAIKLRSLKTA